MNYSLDPIADIPMGKQKALHLLNRAMIGPSGTDVEQFAELTIEESMDILLDPGTEPGPPLQVFGTDPNVAQGETWVDAALDGAVRFRRKKSYWSWWIGELLNQQSSLREKMVLFWHNHFVTEVNVVNIPAYLYDYNQLIRQHALGDFKSMAAGMTVNTAMLRYLDGIKNTAASPNENYSRELFELFTIGKGPLIGEGDYTNYTELDVQEGARVLTGWKLDNETLSAYYKDWAHDKGSKTFSAHYGNQSISNQGETEYLALIDMIFSKKETARALVRKLYRWFVYYSIDEEIELQIIEPLANTLFNNGYDLSPVLRQLLSSQHFFDMDLRACYIKNPLEFILGSLRRLDVSIPDELEVKYEFWHFFRLLSGYQDMELGGPPDVAGWPAYYLAPAYNELWINSATLPQKAEFSAKLLSGNYQKKGYKLIVDVIGLAEKTSVPSDPDQLITEFCELLLPVPISEEKLSELKEVLIPGLPDFEWSEEWFNYKDNPGKQSYKDAVTNALRLLLEAIMLLPEYYLI